MIYEDDDPIEFDDIIHEVYGEIGHVEHEHVPPVDPYEDRSTLVNVKAIFNVDQMLRGETYLVDPSDKYWGAQIASGNVVVV